MQAFSQFKPKQTYFETWKGKRIKNSEKVLKAIEGLKKIEKQAEAEETYKEKIRAKHGQAKSSFFELGEEKARELTKINKKSKVNPYRVKGFLPTFTPKADAAITSQPKQDQGIFNHNSSAPKREWQMVALNDDTQDIFRIQKKVWNQRKMKYVGVTLNAAGTNLDDYKAKLQKDKDRATKLKKKFGLWKRNNRMETPKTGEKEDFDLSRRMRSKFMERKRQKFKIGSGEKGNSRRSNQSRGNGKNFGKRKNREGQISGKKKNRISKMKKKFRK